MSTVTRDPSRSPSAASDVGGGTREVGLGPRPPGLPGLVESKLVVPRARPGQVRRTRLLRQLGADARHRVLSIVAPAGYGKTVLLSQLAAATPRSVAWLTIDVADNEPVTFLTYLAAAIDRVEPLDPAIFAAIGEPTVSSQAVVGRLLAGLRSRSSPILVVLDDGHRLTDAATLDAVSALIDHLPAGAMVAIAGREPPGLPLAHWRAQGSMLDIGPGELALDEHEAAGLLREAGFELAPDATRELTDRTEGWPALLALAAREARRTHRRVAPLVTSRDVAIADYLRSEVLEGRPEAEIVFLTRTSILERLNGDLCDAVAGREGSAGLLASLARSTPLVDEYGGSYRYHALLRDFLRDELEAREPSIVAELHDRAASWLEEDGALDQAVAHAFTGGRLDHAAAIVGRSAVHLHWSGRRAALRGWTRRFDDDALLRYPWLAVLGALEELGVGDVAATGRFADLAERGSYDGRPPDGTASFESGRAIMRAATCRAGAGDMLANASLAVSLEGPDSRWRDFALWQLGLARLVTGDPDSAEATLAQAVAAARANRNDGLGYCLLGLRTLLAADRLDWAAATAFADEARGMAGAPTVEGYLATAPGLAAFAAVAIHRGDLAEARRVLARAVRLRPLMTAASPPLSLVSLIALSRAHLAAGDTPGARTLLAQAGDVIRLRPDLGVLPATVAALKAAIGALPPAAAGGASSLTATELRVLALLPYYLSFKEIGQRLGVKATTIKTHSLSIYAKLGASTRSEAVELAVQAGLLERFPA